MNTIKQDYEKTVQHYKDWAIAIIREFIDKQDNHQYCWIIVGGRRLIFEKVNTQDPYSDIYVWHKLREGEKDLREEDKLELTAAEWVEAASKLQRKVVAFERQLLYLDGTVVGWADLEPHDFEKNNGWVNYELNNLKLRTSRSYELKMVREPQVMTQAEAEVRRFQQIFSGRHKVVGVEPWNVEDAERVFSTIWRSCKGFKSLEDYCWIREAE